MSDQASEPVTDTSNPAGALAALTAQLGRSERLDQIVHQVEPLVERLRRSGAAYQALRGGWLGHALHPALTDLPLGCWTSALVLDLAGGRSSRKAATRLVGLGLVSALPTMATGVAEWGEADARAKRIGVVHAGANAMAWVLFARSWRARHLGAHYRGALWALAGGAAATGGAYLGGHLATLTDVGRGVRSAAPSPPPWSVPEEGAGPLTRVEVDIDLDTGDARPPGIDGPFGAAELDERT